MQMNVRLAALVAGLPSSGFRPSGNLLCFAQLPRYTTGHLPVVRAFSARLLVRFPSTGGHPMRPSLSALVGVMVMLARSPPRAQVIKSPAEVLPAGTLAYIELHQPGILAKEVARLVEGSYLSDVPYSLAPLYAKHPSAARSRPDPA